MNAPFCYISFGKVLVISFLQEDVKYNFKGCCSCDCFVNLKVFFTSGWSEPLTSIVESVFIKDVEHPWIRFEQIAR